MIEVSAPCRKQRCINGRGSIATDELFTNGVSPFRNTFDPGYNSQEIIFPNTVSIQYHILFANAVQAAMHGHDYYIQSHHSHKLVGSLIFEGHSKMRLWYSLGARGI